MTPLIRMQDVSFGYARGRRVLDSVSWSLNTGDFVALVGPNGSGKTTFLRLLSRIYAPVLGILQLDAQPLAAYKSAELARRIAVVPQKAEFAFDYLVEEVVAMGRIPYQGVLGWESAKDRTIIQESIEKAGIRHLQGRSIHTLSGGEQQLTLVARAMAQQSRILLLDEPTSALDLGHQQEIMALFRKLHDEGGYTILLVTHDLNLAAREAKRIVLLSQGRIYQEGSPETVLTSEAIEFVYHAKVTVHPCERGLHFCYID